MGEGVQGGGGGVGDNKYDQDIEHIMNIFQMQRTYNEHISNAKNIY